MKLEEYKDAAILAKEVSPEVKYFIYCYRDCELNKYHPPFVNDKEPSFMVDGLRSSIIKGTAKKHELVGLELCLIGTFELSKGKSEVEEVPFVLVNLDELFKAFGGVNDGKVDE